jgi:phosphoglycolate phosphatase-like HAD superfamily hydrolase
MKYGYSSQESFTAAFHRYFHHPPGQFKHQSTNRIGLGRPLFFEEGITMINDQTVYKLQTIAQQLFSLSQSWGLEATRLGPEAKGLVIVSSETRRLYSELTELIYNIKRDLNSADQEKLRSIAEQCKMLTINSIIESIHGSSSNQLPVLFTADELRMVTEELFETFKIAPIHEKTAMLPSQESTVSNQEIFLLRFKIGKHFYVENLQFIKEITSTVFEDIAEDMDLRGNTIRLIPNAKELLSSRLQKRVELLIIHRSTGLLAVPVEDLHTESVFISPLGQRAVEEGDLRNLPLREIWKGEEDFLFIDWDRL